MSTRDDILDDFDQLVPRLDDLRPRVSKFVADLLEDADIDVQMVDCRVKPRKSLEKKLLRPDYQSLSDITDLLGLRVLTYFPDHVDAVSAVLTREFRVDNARSPDKRVLLAPDRFGYLSRHLVVALSSQRLALPDWRNRGFDDIWFEIQVRTVLQHAWAEIEHDLGYKTDETLPSNFRRRFSRIAGLLEVADDEFRRLRDELGGYREHVEAALAEDGSGLEINQISLTQFVRTSEAIRALDLDIATACAARLQESEAYVGRRAADLFRAQIATLSDLEDQLLLHRSLILAFARAWLAPMAHHELSEGISIFFLALVLVGLTEDEERIEQHFLANGMTESRAQELTQRALRLIREIKSDGS